MVQIITISPIQRREESGEDESAGAGRPGDPAGHRERQLRERRRHLRRHQRGRSAAGTDRHLAREPSLCLAESKVRAERVESEVEMNYKELEVCRSQS